MQAAKLSIKRRLQTQTLIRSIMMLVLLIALTITAAVSLAQDNTVTDGHFVVELPSGWTNDSTDTQIHFISPDSAVNIYLQSVETDDLATGKQTVLTAVDPEFDATPIQTSDVPLPGGPTWSQDVYLVDGALWAVLGTVKDGYAYVMVVNGEQAAFMAATNTINNLLFGFKFSGDAADVLPDYIDQTKFTEQEVTIVSGDYNLPATLTLPVSDQPVPAVILVTGSGPENRDEQIGPNKPFKDIAWGLASNGIAVLRFDERTFVYGKDLDMTTFTLDDEVTDDVLQGIALLRETDAIDPEQIYMLGHSLGAMVAPRIGERASDLAGLILMSGNARQFEVVVAEQFDYLKSLGTTEAELAPVQSMIDWLTALRTNDQTGIDAIPADQRSYFASIVDYDQVATAQTLIMPMLILQGERDYQVTMDDFAVWQDALKSHANVTFHSYPDLNHLMMTGEGKQKPEELYTPGHVSGNVIADIVAWINQ